MNQWRQIKLITEKSSSSSNAYICYIYKIMEVNTKISSLKLKVVTSFQGEIGKEEQLHFGGTNLQKCLNCVHEQLIKIKATKSKILPS